MSNETQETTRVRADFDRIAEFDEPRWNHNSHYQPMILRHLPRRMSQVLEIGCGRGEFSRELATRASRVTAIDLSPRMIELARHGPANSAIDWLVADVMDWPGPMAPVDAIVSIAAFHHLRLESILDRCRRWLVPGGVLVVLDLVRDDGAIDLFRSAFALPVSILLTRWNCRGYRPTAECRAVWDDHGRHDHYLSLAEARQQFSAVLPGTVVRQHLFWRYSAVWHKPAE